MKKVLKTVATVATLSLIVSCGNNSSVGDNPVSKTTPTIIENIGVLPDSQPINQAIKVEKIEEAQVKEELSQDAPTIYNQKIVDNEASKVDVPQDNIIEKAKVEDTTIIKPVATTKVYRVKGSVTDGPVYWANIKIQDPDSKEILATTKSDDNGDYSVDVEGLPDIYRVVVSDGKDSGVDALRDDNDEAVPFTMSALVKRNSDGVIVEDGTMPVESANVSPATTLVDTIVEDGQMPLEEAQTLVANSFEVKEDKALSQIDNKKHLLSNKLSNLIAFLAKLTPVEDKNIAIKSMARLVMKNEMHIRVSDKFRLDLSEFNLSKISNEANIIMPNSISPEDIAKFDISQNAIKPMLSNILDDLDVASDIRNRNRFTLLSKQMALFELVKEIKSLSYSELDVDMLSSFADATQTTLEGLLSGIDDVNKLDSDNIDFVSGLIRENLGEDIALLKPKIIKATTQYRVVIKKTTKVRVRKMVKHIYRNSSLEAFEDIFKSLQDESIIEELSNLSDDINAQTTNESDDIKNELDNELIDLSAKEIVHEIEKSKTIKIEKIKSIKKESINNRLLVDTIKSKVKIRVKIKIKSKTKRLTRDDNIKIVTTKTVIKSIKVTTTYKVFTKTTQENSDKLYNESIKNLQDNINELQNRITALQYLIFNLNNLFNVDEFKTTTKDTLKVIKTIKESGSINVTNSLYSIKTKIKKEYSKKVEITTVIKEVQDNIEDYKKPKDVHKAKTINLIRPSLPSMPDEFKKDMKVRF